MADDVNKTWITAINSATNGGKKSVSVHIIPVQIQKPTGSKAFCTTAINGRPELPTTNRKYVQGSSKHIYFNIILIIRDFSFPQMRNVFEIL